MKCDCGVTKVYGVSASRKMHSEWCSSLIEELDLYRETYEDKAGIPVMLGNEDGISYGGDTGGVVIIGPPSKSCYIPRGKDIDKMIKTLNDPNYFSSPCIVGKTYMINDVTYKYIGPMVGWKPQGY